MSPHATAPCAASDVRDQHGQLGHYRSLAGVDLGSLRLGDFDRVERIELSAGQTQSMVDAIVDDSTRAAARIAAGVRHAVGSGTDPESVGAAVHRVLTRGRFLKGSRSLLDVPTVVSLVRQAVRAGAPVRLVTRGFPFKQYDSGLKAAGRLPDLAELGGLVRLWELVAAITACYPPGVDLWVRQDGGYHRPRAETDIEAYTEGLRRLQAQLGLPDFVSWFDDRQLAPALLDADQETERKQLIEEFVDRIEAIAAPAAEKFDAPAASAMLAAAFVGPAVGGVAPFAGLFRSLVFSSPIPAPAGVRPWEYARRVLARIEVPDSDPEVSDSRRQLLRRAWLDTIRFQATQLADAQVGVWDRLPPHIRLVNNPGLDRGVIGFSPLGGSGLLPWHGTGCLDDRGLVSVNFLAVLADRGFVPVTSELLGSDQPFLMVPPSSTGVRNGRLVLRDGVSPRLRPR